MGFEEGFSSDNELKERRPLFGRLRGRNREVEKPEGADAFLRELRLQTEVFKALVGEVQELNANLHYIGAVLDSLHLGENKSKEVVE